jgi:hypothetical protein
MPHPTLGQDIAAAIVLHPNTVATEKDVLEFAAGRLAEFKVPRKIVFVKELPKGPTGKPQRIGLAEKLGLFAPGSDRPTESAVLYVKPSTPMERALATIWCEVLRLERAGATDNFFHLGGDSLLAAQIMTRASQRLGIDVAAVSLFETPTIAALAKSMEPWEIACR